MPEKREKIRAVVIDLDGTLLNSEKHISQRAISVIRKVESMGVRVFIATGRSLNTCSRYIEELGINHPVICYNGSCIWDPLKGEDIYHTHLAEEVCREIVKIEGDVNCSFHAYRRHQVHFSHASRYPEYLSHLTLHTGSPQDDISSLDTFEFTKVIFIGEFRETEKVRTHLTKTFGEAVHQVYSRPRFFEIMRGKATKGDALKKLLAHEKISPEEVMVIGDENNDLAMLALAGHPVAMGNATKEVKSIARYETSTCDEDGAAEIIEKLLLS